MKKNIPSAKPTDKVETIPAPAAEVAAAPSSDLPEWSCKLESTPQTGEFTVGEIAQISCSGDKPVDFGKGNIAIHYPDDYMFALHMYDLVSVKSNEIVFKAVSYRVGKWDLSHMSLSEDGQDKLKLNGLVYPVKTVQDPQNPRKEPFGPADPFFLSWPKYVYIAGGVFVALIVGMILLLITKNIRRKSWERKVAKHDTAMQPYHQFQKDLRIIRREFDFSAQKKWSTEDINKYLDNLNQSFKLFILREFRVPALDWKQRSLFSEMKKKRKRRFYVYEKKLSQAFTELDRAQKHPEKLKNEDCQKLMMLCRDTSTEVWKTHLGGAS